MNDCVARFGPAGNSESFTAMGYKQTLQVPEYLLTLGLDHYEYQCGRGVNVSEEKAVAFGALMKEKGLTVSLHAPYYISMSSLEEEKRLHSVDYILQSARAVSAMGGDRIVVHTGSCGKLSREEAMRLAKDTMGKALAALRNEHLDHVHICPETMGKINQLGNMEEVMLLCEMDESLIPCIDFGHLNARTMGGLATKNDFRVLLDEMCRRLGNERGRSFHAHFSKIEYTTGGEKRHLTFDDTVYGPSFEPLMELLAERGCCPTVVCESAGTQAEDAKSMKEHYLSAKRGVIHD